MRQFITRKNISGIQSLENISDKRLRVEVQPAQTNRVESWVVGHQPARIMTQKKKGVL